MKAMMNVLGFLAFFGVITGIVFKMMHWPGAGVILVAGAFILNVGYLPMYFIDRYKRSII